MNSETPYAQTIFEPLGLTYSVLRLDKLVYAHCAKCLLPNRIWCGWLIIGVAFLMKQKLSALLFIIILGTFLKNAQSLELTYYLPESPRYDPGISTPEASIGFQVGEWHVRPELIERYMRQLEKDSPRVKIEITGYTHEKRPLMLAYISSPENIERLDQIRQKQMRELSESSTSSTSSDNQNNPIVTWMGYSVHGNEASGANASLLLAYHLAAATDEATKSILRDQVIIIDPVLNPDGLARFANWVNSRKSKTPNPDPNDIEHNEAWPSGRTNHYWFDLNRDWLLLQHPESRARVTQFHQWRPHILTDFHEMGTNSSYFFQPGVPSRQNPLTPEANFKMTATIAQYHAKALDDIGSLYYSKENFDDFYYGKGSTYPDIHGTVGILFEQASARGHIQDGTYGQVSFPFAIRNHLTTSLSTLNAAQAYQMALRKMRRDFITESRRLAQKDKNRAVIVGSKDAYRLAEFERLMQGHSIEVSRLAKKVTVNKRQFLPNEALVIPTRQSQYRLIQAMFETRTKFEDQVFYDVSAWNLAMAFDLDFAFLGRSDYDKSLMSSNPESSVTGLAELDSAIALAFDWADFNSTRLLSELHQKGLRVQTVTKPTTMNTKNGRQSLRLGSIILSLSNQSIPMSEITQWLKPRLAALNIKPILISSGLALNGVDLGSPSISVLKPVKPAMLVGDKLSGYAVGEIWHLLDQRLNQPVTMLTLERFLALSENDYTHLIFADGTLKPNKKQTEALANWIKKGGNLIAHSRSAKWLLEQEWTSSEAKSFDKPVDTKAPYSQRAQVAAEHVVGGAITSAIIDVSHPLGFGLDDAQISIFKRGQLVFTEPKESFVAIARFDSKPLATGYMSAENQTHIADGVSLLVQRLGKGRVIAFSDNPVFRGYWLGTARIFANALYFSEIMRAPPKSKDKKAEVKAKKTKVNRQNPSTKD